MSAPLRCVNIGSRSNPSRWLRGLLDELASDGVVAVTTTARIDDPGWWRNAAFNIGQPLAMWCFRFVHGHHCLSGFSFAIRRGVYEASGGFDPNLNAEEDADLSRSVARFGKIKLLHAPVTFSGAHVLAVPLRPNLCPSR